MDTKRARRILLAERERLMAALQSEELAGLSEVAQKDALSELAEVDHHPADMGTETYEREKNVSIRMTLEAELEDIDQALWRLEQGTFGLCEVCARPIPNERLEAVPGTRFCVEHQREAERSRRAG